MIQGAHRAQVTSVALSLQTGRIFSASIDKHVRAVEQHILLLHFSTGIDRAQLKVWDLSTRGCIATLQGHDLWIERMVYDEETRTILTGSRDNTVRLWDPRTSRELARLAGSSSFFPRVIPISQTVRP